VNAAELAECDPKGPLCIRISKLLINEQAQNFYAFGRVISGTLKSDQQVKVLGEGYTPDEEEDMTVKTASKIWILQAGGRFRIQLDQVSAGNLIAIEGVDDTITKTATLVAAENTA